MVPEKVPIKKSYPKNPVIEVDDDDEEVPEPAAEDEEGELSE